ncbi:MAG: hypothetical protein A3C90_04155 [Candidatus Magasanikbacteria bacterium RIFCSPHIGHO2_02_FULL_51_14]|uniref:Addiction module antitoxin, RelB/DinJ family n=1 Tax=Candidatus Magasanikbacteria bacterium RIFCSPHIGHO2_02_FULL_51_14 TaxID=1798683 RepID=A0A1F6MDA3_9BACT|nr:MAG: hypothetical protein A3C90_04155 [Candidatus Magasanikbacteria bacterium RIFCSPHIGHO2_02_FULL_51_14]
MKTALHIKVDTQVKRRARTLADKLGIPLSTLVNGMLSQLVRSETVVLSTARQMTPELEAYLDEIWDDIEQRKNFVGPFATAREIREYFHNV